MPLSDCRQYELSRHFDAIRWLGKIIGWMDETAFKMSALSISQHVFRFFLRAFSRLLYCIRVYGQQNIPEGGALLVSNHISWLDGFLIMMVTKRPVRPLVYAGNFQGKLVKWWAESWGTIMMGTGPKSIRSALKVAQQAIHDGELILIFPEGGISRTGQLHAFKPGMMKILDGIDAPVVPIFLDELWGSLFSFSRAKFFWKMPQRWRYPISIHYGKPIPHASSAPQVRQAVQTLSSEVAKYRMKKFLSLPKSFIKSCKRRRFQKKIADSQSGSETGGRLLLRTLILRRLLRRYALDAGEKNVGVLLPPSNGGVIVNMALALDQRVAVNLNYTVSEDVINECIRAAGIKHVLTSRQVMSKLEFHLDAELVELEDFKEKVSLLDKILGAIHAFVTPAWLLNGLLSLGKIQPRDLATIIFTSGSTGAPKGVMLTYENIASNVEAIDQIIHLNAQDTVVGLLPFFHSFGYTVTLWTPMALNIGSVYHYNPLDSKRIGVLTKKHQATVLLATPTFLRGYMKRCKPEQFKSLDVVVCGAEKLSSALADAFEDKFGVRPVEGYGCTELSPLVSVNVPPSRSHAVGQIDRLEGTVGRTIPGVAAKAVHPDTFDDLDVGQTGMLLVKGPNVMKGYLNMEEKTAEVIQNGWYCTGDIGFIDNQGFIHITGRQSRFSKIGGEMVPHIKVEDELARLVGDEEDDGIVQIAVTAVPDEKKGERLIVLHTQINLSPDELRRGLTEAGLPNIFIPAVDAFIQVDKIPVLGTGKLDLRSLKDLAVEVTGSGA